MPSKIVNQRNFELNTRKIREFCKKYGMDLVELNNGYQMRIEDLVDLYPVRGRWHNIKTGERGDWFGEEDLRKLMLFAIPEMKVVEVKDGEMSWPKTDGEMIIGNRPFEVNKLEPIEMFYKKPKWWQWRLRRKYRKILETK